LFSVKATKWFKCSLRKIRKRQAIDIIAESKGRIVGKASARKGIYKQCDNVTLGIAILPAFRGAGLGKILLTELIARVKREFKPKNIVLSVFAPNKRAHALYKKVGFREFARFPNWFKHKGKYYDQIYLILRKPSAKV